jgi:hypothetical protein
MKKIIFPISLVFATASFSCEKIYNTTWVYYDETRCADSWDTNENTPENEKIKAVEEYFKDKGIKIFKIEIAKDGTPEACDACHCKSGNRTKCKIKERDLSKMEKEGFYQ